MTTYGDLLSVNRQGNRIWLLEEQKVEVISPLHIFLLFTLNIWIYTFLIIKTFICENTFF